MKTATKEFFSGQFVIKSLPVVEVPATRVETQARLLSPKGELAVMSEGAIDIRHLAYVELREGMLRGDHYHKLRHEYFYLISGEVTLNLQAISSGERATTTIRTGDLVFIKPGIAHSLIPARPGHAIEFAAESFDLADVYRHVLDQS